MASLPEDRGDSRLTQAALDGLLATLDHDRAKAGQRYERLRERLVFFFSRRNFVFADRMADEVLTRIAGRVAAGESIGAVGSYAYGVARHVAQEETRRELRQSNAEQTYARDISVANDTSYTRALESAMEVCLGTRSEADRQLLLGYYLSGGQDRIQHRQVLATSLGLSSGALRKRVFRLREAVETCVRARLSREVKDVNDGHNK